MAVTLIVYIVLAIATATSIRPHYATPMVESGWDHPAGSGWGISSWIDAPDGQRLRPGAVYSLVPARVQNSQSPDAFTNWLTSHGYTLWQSWQPDSRFWQFQRGVRLQPQARHRLGVAATVPFRVGRAWWAGRVSVLTWRTRRTWSACLRAASVRSAAMYSAMIGVSMALSLRRVVTFR